MLQHVPFEGPGLIAEAAAAEAGLELQVRHVYDGEPCPTATSSSGLVVMGGPMGVADDGAAPAPARPNGICSPRPSRRAARFSGSASGRSCSPPRCGGRVIAGRAGEEIGLGIVELTADGRADPVFGPAGRVLPVLHWHGDTYDAAEQRDAPARARPRATRSRPSGSATRAYGLQFHVEVDAAGG